MSEYSEGICEDGAAILKDGIPLTITEILAALRRAEEDKRDAERYRWLKKVRIREQAILKYLNGEFAGSMDGLVDAEMSMTECPRPTAVSVAKRRCWMTPGCNGKVLHTLLASKCTYCGAVSDMEGVTPGDEYGREAYYDDQRKDRGWE